MTGKIGFLLFFIFGLICVIESSKHNLIAGRWQEIGSAPKYSNIKLQFSLIQPGKHQLERIVQSVSDPRSANYGNYLSHKQLAEVLSTPLEEVNSLRSYLESNGGFQCDLIQTNDMLQCIFSVNSVEKLFNVKMRVFECIFTGRYIIRTTDKYQMNTIEYSSLIELISGISDFAPFSSTHQFSKLATYLQLDNQAKELEEPFYITVRSRDLGRIKVEFIPPCLGSSSSSPFATGACAENPIFTIEVWASPNTNTIVGEVNSVYVVLPANCTTTVAKGHYYTCTFYLDNMDAYVPWNISFRLHYDDKTASPQYVYPWFSVSDPQLLVQSVQSFYNIPQGSFVTNPNATQCVTEFEQQYYNNDDLIQFFEINGLPDLSKDVILIGPNNQSLPGTEASLDLQWIMGLAPGSITTFWSNQANSSVEIDHILSWQYAIGNATNPPLVSSVSYAMTESTADFYLGAGYIERSNTEFQKLASMGLTMIFSAGDAGANSFAAPPMDVISCFPSHAMWPADSPYVTAVSATYFTPLAEPLCYYSSDNGGINCLDNPLGEVAVGIDYGMFWTTGGGFSDIFAQPSYQTTKVNSYLTSTSQPDSSYFNASGRGYPDVSSVGHNLIIVDGGNTRTLDGTSASAPIFAAMITLLNNARLNAGKPPLGFLNPFLYDIATSFPGSYNDITVGHNACGGFGPPVCCEDGFYASPGWDAVTGLGTPNYPVFYDAAMHF